MVTISSASAENGPYHHPPEPAGRRQRAIVLFPPTISTDFQSFLAGAPFFGEAGGGVGNHDYRIPAYSWFAQDDYRASKT